MDRTTAVRDRLRTMRDGTLPKRIAICAAVAVIIFQVARAKSAPNPIPDVPFDIAADQYRICLSGYTAWERPAEAVADSVDCARRSAKALLVLHDVLTDDVDADAADVKDRP